MSKDTLSAIPLVNMFTPAAAEKAPKITPPAAPATLETAVPDSPLTRKRKQQAQNVIQSAQGTILSDAAGNKETLG